MREIKFRSWVESESVSYMNYNIEFAGGLINDIFATSGKEPTTPYGSKITYMQYAELNDKDDTPIFDGDVIYWEIDNGVGIESYTAVVCWSEDLVEEGWNKTYQWLVKYTTDYLRGGFDELSLPAAYNSGLRVIGNIHENPELLEVQGE